MKKIIYLLIVLSLSFQMTSCEKSEDESYSSMIVGTWREYKWYDGLFDETHVYDENCEECDYVMFKKDGTGMYYEYNSYIDEIVDETWFTWSITDNLLNIRYNNDMDVDYEKTKDIIKTLTDENLVIETDYYGLQHPVHDFYISYYVRVK